MKKTIYRTINGKDFVFYVSSKRNGYGTTERADLFVEFDTGYNGEFTGFYRWSNRPWQAWNGADACKHATKAYRDFLRECLLDEFKRERGYERMNAKRNEEFAPILANDDEYQTALALLDSLETEYQKPTCELTPAEIVGDGCTTFDGWTIRGDNALGMFCIGAAWLFDPDNNHVCGVVPSLGFVRVTEDDSEDALKHVNAFIVSFFDMDELSADEWRAMPVRTVAECANAAIANGCGNSALQAFAQLFAS